MTFFNMEYIFEEVRITEINSPKFTLEGEEIDIWSEEYVNYHSKSVSEYIRDKLIEFEKKGIDPFA